MQRTCLLGIADAIESRIPAVKRHSQENSVKNATGVRKPLSGDSQLLLPLIEKKTESNYEDICIYTDGSKCEVGIRMVSTRFLNVTC